MKTMGLVMLSFIVFVLLANPSIGEEIKPGVEYHIIPALIGGGGLTTGKNINGNLCPPDVIQAHDSFERGRPVIFSHVKPENKVVQPLTNVNIMFPHISFCQPHHFIWTLDEFDKKIERICVTTQGRDHQGPPNTMKNWFKIEKKKDTDDYTLLSCSSECETCKVLCRNLGIFFDSNKVGRLCHSDKPLVVKIEKANPITTSSY